MQISAFITNTNPPSLVSQQGTHKKKVEGRENLSFRTLARLAQCLNVDMW